jgi:hypothetical protein
MTTPVEDLKAQRDQIALEMLSIPAPVQRLQHIVPVAKTMLHHLQGLVSRNAPAIAPLTAQQHEFLSKVAGRNYVNLSQMPVKVPEGLRVPYLQYLHILGEATAHAVQVVERLNKFTVFLGQLINEHSFQLSTKMDRAYYHQLKAQRDEFNRMLGECFIAGSGKTDALYGDVVQRNSDWKPVFEALNLVSEQINHVNRRTLDKKIEEAAHYLDIIADKATRGDLAQLTPQILHELAEGSYEMGREVEQYVAIWYKATALTESLNKTTTSLLSVYAEA